MTEFLDSQRTYERMLDPEPAFLAERVGVLESGAASGELTGSELRFSAGIETEFGLYDPVKFRKGIGDGIDTDHPDVLIKHLDSRQQEIDKILQTDQISSLEPKTMSDEELEAHRAPIRDFIKALQPSSENEAIQQQNWLADVDNFRTQEFINFKLYSEFSHPKLKPAHVPKGASYEELEEASNSLGWLEFSFGTGKYQSGYYDNEGVSEIRLAPCPPSELIRRHGIIMQRLGEIATEFGSLVSVAGSHINLGVYARNDGGKLMPMIGNDIARQQSTLDLIAGTAAAFYDKVWLSQKEMRYGFMHSKHHTPSLSFGPARVGVRIQDDYLELRASNSFQSIAHGIAWLMAGSITGAKFGADALKATGYEIPAVTETYHVKRAEGFDKLYDLHVQRAFEHTQMEDGIFKLDMGFNLIKGGEIAQALLAETDERSEWGSFDTFNDTIFAATKLGENGMVTCDVEQVKKLIDASENDKYRQRLLDTWFPDGIGPAVAVVNKQLAKIRLEPVEVVKGRIETENMDPITTIKRLINSPIAHLEFGDSFDDYLEWLEARADIMYRARA